MIDSVFLNEFTPKRVCVKGPKNHADCCREIDLNAKIITNVKNQKANNIRENANEYIFHIALEYFLQRV